MIRQIQVEKEVESEENVFEFIPENKRTVSQENKRKLRFIVVNSEH